MMNEYNKTKADLVVSLLEKNILPDPDEVDAVVSHWLQSPMNTIPYLSPPVRKHCWEVLKSSTSNSQRNSLAIQEQQACYQTTFLINWEDTPFPPPQQPNFTFIDLFAGIGGFRIAMQELGGKCLFSSEWDVDAKKTYERNFGEVPFGDIRKINEDNIPDHDILCAGFPCQPFSLAGVSARNSRNIAHGFACETQGTLFFDIARIVKEKRPKIVFLENVRNLIRHDGGKTFSTIQNTIEKLGYSFSYKLIDSSPLVPQRRVRCYMVCIRDDKKGFEFPEIEGTPLPLKSILEKNVNDSFTISEKLWAGHQRRTKRNIERGTGFTAFCADLDKPSKTIVARYGKDGKECLIPQVGKPPRMLTLKECARLQGFPEIFIMPVAKTKAYRQFGNSVAVPVIRKISEQIHSLLKENIGGKR